MTYSLEDQIGQMILLGFRGTTAEPQSAVLRWIRDCRIGGVYLSENETPMGRTIGNIESPDQLRSLTQTLQGASRIGLFVTLDAEGGQVIRLKERYGFPPTRSAQDLGTRDDVTETRRQSAQLARTLRTAGVNLNFAPVLDLNRNPHNRALNAKQRCYSEDPDVVTRHARVVIEEHHRERIGCVLKHFPGHGSTIADSHLDLADVSDTWSPDELEPFRRLIALHLADGVMTAHVLLRRYDAEQPATLSRVILTDLLRNDLKFEGVILSDDLNMGAIQRNFPYEEAVARAVEAGVDIVLNANVDTYDDFTAERTFAVLMEHVKAGRLSRERIERSFTRIMTLKHRLGLE